MSLRERLATLEHERWSRWMRWMFDHWTEENIVRWKQQMETPYEQLSEREKDSDRKEADNTLLVLRSATVEEVAEAAGLEAVLDDYGDFEVRIVRKEEQ